MVALYSCNKCFEDGADFVKISPGVDHCNPPFIFAILKPKFQGRLIVQNLSIVPRVAVVSTPMTRSFLAPLSYDETMFFRKRAEIEDHNDLRLKCKKKLGKNNRKDFCPLNYNLSVEFVLAC